MKKSLISLAVVASIAASGVANAAPTAYGFIDVSIWKRTLDATGAVDPDLTLTSNTSAFGIKGSEDLGDGLKALYKMEFQVNVADRCSSDDTTVDFTGTSTGSKGCDAIVDRDQFVGLKGGMGKVVIGTTSSNYKQMGGKIDPFYRTALQARSVGQQSVLHSGAGVDGGRMDNVVQYTSPKMGGIQAVVNTTFSGGTNGDESTGIGIRYETKALTVWFDTLSGAGTASNGSTRSATPDGSPVDSATKIGAKFKATKELTIGAQIESIESTGTGAASESDVMFLSATFAMDKNNIFGFSYGSTDDVAAGFNLGLWHLLSKKTSLYVALNSTSDEQPGAASVGANDGGSSTIAFGMRKKF